MLGVPEYEKRDIKVSNIDLEVLLKTRQLLSKQEDWVNDSLRDCDGKVPFNLFCALKTASEIVDGEYIHRRPALQEVRFTINDMYKSRWKVHRLADFNKNSATTYGDIVSVLETTILRVKEKLNDK